jgi:hypothetical protein
MILGCHLLQQSLPDQMYRRRARSPPSRLTAWLPCGMTAEPPSPSSTCHWARRQASTGVPDPAASCPPNGEGRQGPGRGMLPIRDRLLAPPFRGEQAAPDTAGYRSARDSSRTAPVVPEQGGVAPSPGCPNQAIRMGRGRAVPRSGRSRAGNSRAHQAPQMPLGGAEHSAIGCQFGTEETEWVEKVQLPARRWGSP